MNVRTSWEDLGTRFALFESATVVIEAGPSSVWVKAAIEEIGHEVLVANPRKLALIYGNHKKNDKVDAENLARLGRLDRELLAPINLRSLESLSDLAVLRARDLFVKQRTELINHVRSMCSGFGHPLPPRDSHYFHRRFADSLPKKLVPALKAALEQIKDLNAHIREYDKKVERLSKTKYPETTRLREVPGVGSLIALAFVLTLHDRHRFKDSREVGAFLGLVPRQDQSCGHNPQLRISKAGDATLRKLMVMAGQRILRDDMPDCDLKRHGLRICPDSQSKGAKKRAVVAVARKTAVLLHRLWITDEPYDPFRNSERPKRAGRGRMKTSA